MKSAMSSALIGCKRAIASVIQSPPIGMAIGVLYSDIIPFHGLPIDVRNANIPPSNKAALRFGMYESAEYRFVKSFLRPNLPVIELGSSIGAISSAIARQLARGERLTCVEANPALIPTLKSNLLRNASHLQVEVIHAAVAYDTDVVRFGVSANNLTSSIPADPSESEVIVAGVTLSALLEKENQVPYQLVADIEGAEVDVLLRDVDALRGCRLMVMELHDTVRSGQAYSTGQLESLIVSAGFAIVARYGHVVVCQSSRE